MPCHLKMFAKPTYDNLRVVQMGRIARVGLKHETVGMARAWHDSTLLLGWTGMGRPAMSCLGWHPDPAGWPGMAQGTTRHMA